MSFFLLGKDSDDELHLLSSRPLASRQEAMAELSRLTADPSFGHWDTEVLVMELDKGTPVLLVRPVETVPPAAPESDDVEIATSEGDAVEIAAPEVDEREVVADDETEETPAPEEDAVPEIVEAYAEAEPDPALAAVIEDLGADESADTEVASLVEGDDSVAVVADEVVVVSPIDATPAADSPSSESDTPASLKDALKRTAAQMESEGIVAPDSVGAVSEAEPSPAQAERVEEPDTAETIAAWPWDTAAADDGFSLDALEEPAREATPLVTAAGDDDTVAASRPVILGSYGDAEVASASSETVEVAESTQLVDAWQPEPSAQPVADEAVVPDTSDFILDLEPVAPEASTEGMTCEDCVYVRTCPNSGQRDPKDCGSFQWK